MSQAQMLGQHTVVRASDASVERGVSKDAGSVLLMTCREGQGWPSLYLLSTARICERSVVSGWPMFVAVLLTIFAASGAIAATLSGPANIAEPASLSKMPTFMRPIPQAAVRPLRMQDLRSQYPNGTKIIMPVENLRETATPEQLSAAEGIESVLVKQMIDEMRKSVPENDLVPLSQGERIFRAMLDDEYAKVISGQGQLGISDLVLAELKGKR